MTSDPFFGGEDAPRIEKVSFEGRDVWVKRPERLEGRIRWQKGDPQKAFERERLAHERLERLGLPVPGIVASTPDYIATETAGPNILYLMRQEGMTSDVFQTAMVEAATALAAFHAVGVSHGRPNLKDICWRDGDIRFLDFERATPDRDTPKGHATDVLLFFYNAIAETGGSGPAVQAAAAAYRSADRSGIWALAKRRAQHLRPLRHLTAVLPAKLRAKKDFAGIGPFFAFFQTD